MSEPKTIGLFYGSSTCYTEMAGEKICKTRFDLHELRVWLALVCCKPLLFANIMHLSCTYARLQERVRGADLSAKQDAEPQSLC